MSEVSLTGVERFFDRNNMIVSKTNLTGHITYCNKTFIDISGYSEQDLIGAPHSILRHPDMPRTIFKYMWNTLGAGKEIFAYVVNRCANGDHYWVFAHVTPSYDQNGSVAGYHSNRRVPNPLIVENTIIPLYRQLRAEEQKHTNRKDGLKAGYDLFQDFLKQKGIAYDELIFSL